MNGRTIDSGRWRLRKAKTLALAPRSRPARNGAPVWEVPFGYGMGTAAV